MTAEVGDFKDEEITRATDLLQEVGLDYMEMGQTLDTLSSGEAQRLKLTSRLQNKRRVLYFGRTDLRFTL